MSNNNSLYLFIDDSGQLSKRDNIMTFGGLIFFDLLKINTFLNDYKSIINSLKSKYPKYQELKHSNLKHKDTKKLINLINNYLTFAVIIDNNKIYKSILKNPKSKGRYLDYAIKMTIKKIIKDLIYNNIINPYYNLTIKIYIDESNFKSNGYYNLKDSIYEELKYGMRNIKNNTNFSNLIYGNLNVLLYYVDSSSNYLIQASDIVAGFVRKSYIQKSNLDNINYLIYLPKKC